MLYIYNLLFLYVPFLQFPYAAPPPQEPVKTLRSLINIRKDTLRLVRYAQPLITPLLSDILFIYI